MKDRLPDLQARMKAKNNELRKNSFRNSSVSSSLLAQISDLRSSITALENLVDEVARLHKDILAAPQQDQKMDNRLRELMSSISQKAYGIRASLQEFEKNKDETLLQNSGKSRIQNTQHMMISREFFRVMNKYNTIQSEYRDQCKMRLRKQLTIAGLSFSDDKIDELLEQRDPGIFTHAIMADTEAAKRSLSDIEARHADIIRLQKSIEEMHDLFFNISLLVEQQGDLVDRIESTINKTVDYTGQSRAKLSMAVQQQKKGRRRKLICMIILVILGLFLIIAIASAIGLT